jgi:hypothetical protein
MKMLFYGILALFFGWLLILSYFVYKTRKHYFNLTSQTKKQRLDEILEKLLNEEDKDHQQIEEIKKQITVIENKSNGYFQKLGLVRFNPFGRTEGEKSFVWSLLDKENNGLVINFIYTHEGIRVYSKRIKNGKGEEYELSEEEQTAINKAK